MIDLRWKVPSAGYEWQWTTPDREATFNWYLIVHGEGRYTTNAYPVFKKTGLFRDFASTTPDRDGVLLFANTYGSLTNLQSRKATSVLRPRKDEPGSNDLVKGESFDPWRKEIEAMSHAVDIWAKAKSGDSAWLSTFINWSDDEVSYAAPSGSAIPPTPIASKAYKPERLALFRHGDMVDPAMYVLQIMVNTKLREHAVSPQLLWDRTNGPAKLRVLLNPRNLLSAMWVQFAYAIEGDRDYRRCDQCQKWFEVAAEKREDARFCSNACRFKAYRIRQKQARRLHSEGKTLMEIAGQIGSDLQTVKGWVKP